MRALLILSRELHPTQKSAGSYEWVRLGFFFNFETPYLAIPFSRRGRDKSSPTSGLTSAESRIAGQDRRRGGSSSRHAHHCSRSCIAGHGDGCTSGLTDAVGGGPGEGRNNHRGDWEEFGETHGDEIDVI